MQVLALDSESCFGALMEAEAAGAATDPVRRAAIAAASDAEWQSATRAFIAQHSAGFAHGVSSHPSSQLAWTKVHEEFQVAHEDGLEALLARAGVDASDVLSRLSSAPPPSAAGLTPLADHAWRPLYAFVEYGAFEAMMKLPRAAGDAGALEELREDGL